MQTFAIYTPSEPPVLAGHLIVQPDTPPHLSIIDTGPAGKKLAQTWEEISARPHLDLSQEKTQKRAGDDVQAHGTSLTPPHHPDYPWAIYETLEKEYGYTLEKSE